MKQPQIAASTASSRSTSSRKTMADLPPSSMVAFFTVEEARHRTRLPVVELPVKETLSTRGWAARVSPTVSPRPTTTFTTPLGISESSTIFTSSRSVQGVSTDGLMTTLLPVARGAASMAAPSRSGAFHGTIWAHTPTGSLRTYGNAAAGARYRGMGSSKHRLAALANHSKRFWALVTMVKRQWDRGDPRFCVSRSAKSMAFCLNLPRMSSRIRERSAGSLFLHRPSS